MTSTKPRRTLKVGDHVAVKGHRSNLNGRLMASGYVKAVHDDGTYTVNAGVMKWGMVSFVGIKLSNLVSLPS